MKQIIPHISVIVPAYNEEKNIKACITGLQTQTYTGDYEIIVVDNGSTDQTASIARRSGANVLSEKRKGQVFALIRGIKQSRSEIIALTDADTLVPADWLDRFVEVFQNNPEAVCVGGPVVYYDHAKLPDWLILSIQHLLLKIGMWSPNGPNMAFYRMAYEKARGFDSAVNLQNDRYLAHKLKKIGSVLYVDNQQVSTSGRRFRTLYQTVQEISRRSINALALRFFQKTIFTTFTDERE